MLRSSETLDELLKKITEIETCSEEEKPPNRILEMMRGQRIFITGGTGFIGKVFIEKVLRTTPTVDKIYMLIRNKKGFDHKKRLEEIFKNKLYDKLKEEHGPEIISKVIPISGDGSLPGLGISDEDRELLCEEVTIVFHGAAIVRFDEPLKKTLLINVRGTKSCLELALGMKNLKLFLHISTAYCHLSEKVLYEKTYPPPADPHKILKMIELLDEEAIEILKKKILGIYPNSYSFSKAISEGLVNEQMDNLPVVICRPSIVCPIFDEPYKGWTDNINGPTGLLIGAGKGVIRTMYIGQSNHADLVPVDLACSGLILIIHNWIANNDFERRIFHLTTGKDIIVNWKDILDLGRVCLYKYPLNWCAWFPGGSMKSNRFLHHICMFFFHWLPAYFVDAIIVLTGNKPILTRVQKRITKGFEIVEYYTNREWEFSNEAFNEVPKRFNTTELNVYKMDPRRFNPEQYFCDCILAVRDLILNEPSDTLPTARIHFKMMWYVDRALRAYLWYFFISLFWTGSTYYRNLLIVLINVISIGLDPFCPLRFIFRS